MDVHARNCVLGDMDGNGKFRGNHPFITSEVNIIKVLKSIKAKKKFLVMEAGRANPFNQLLAGDFFQDLEIQRIIFPKVGKCLVDIRPCCVLGQDCPDHDFEPRFRRPPMLLAIVREQRFKNVMERWVHGISGIRLHVVSL